MIGSDRGATSDFSAVASRYDATRDVPQAQLRACYQRLIHRRLLPPTGVVLDAGCGTGQMSIVLAEMGYQVRGVDVSPAMVTLAQAKCRPEWRARYLAADVRSLPVNDDCFDAVVVSKLFMHVADWQAACRELLRVLRPGACILQLNDAGSFGHPVRKYFAERADALGSTDRFVGLDPRDNTRLVEFFAAQGCERLPIDVTDLRWEKRVSYGDALGQLEERLLVEFWSIPAPAYARILADTARWVDAQPRGQDQIGLLAPYLTADVFRKPGI